MKKIILKTTAKKKEPRQKGAGLFYGVLFTAIITVGTTAYIMSSRDRAMTDLAENAQSKITQATAEQEPLRVEIAPEDAEKFSQKVLVDESLWQSDDVLPVTEDSPETSQEDISDDSVAVSAEAATPLTHLITPVSGDIIKPHSDTELVYSNTMEDWRLHKGVDIGAPIGTTVFASADGEISECYTDIATGATIIIDHGAGLVTRYSNLASTAMVEVGRFVEAGTAIGVVGDTAEFEVADPAHLHFEVIRDGRCTDPEEFFDR